MSVVTGLRCDQCHHLIAMSISWLILEILETTDHRVKDFCSLECVELFARLIEPGIEKSQKK